MLAPLAVVQFIIAPPLVSAKSWLLLALAVNPLVHLIVAISLYFFSSLMAQLAGCKLPRLFNVLYVAVWGGSAVIIAIVAAQPPAELSSYPPVLSVLQYLLRSLTFWGWGLYLLLHLRKVDDLLERRYLRFWVILLLAGYGQPQVPGRPLRTTDRMPLQSWRYLWFREMLPFVFALPGRPEPRLPGVVDYRSAGLAKLRNIGKPWLDAAVSRSGGYFDLLR